MFGAEVYATMAMINAHHQGVFTAHELRQAHQAWLDTQHVQVQLPPRYHPEFGRASDGARYRVPAEPVQDPNKPMLNALLALLDEDNAAPELSTL
jgi:hypothetical protein